MMLKTNSLFYAVVGIVFAGLIYLLAPILTPFLIAALISYLTAPVVNKITHLGIPRLLAVIIVFLVMIVIVVLFFLLLTPLIQKQIMMLVDIIPKIIIWFQSTFLPWISNTFDISEDINVDMIKATLTQNLTKAGGIASLIFQAALSSGMALFVWLTNLVLIPVVTFYLLRDWNSILNNVRQLLPRSVEPTVVNIIKQCDQVLSEFFRGQLLVMLSLAAIYSIGLTLLGLQIGLVIGLISGLVSIVPYLGFIVGIAAATIAAYIQFGTLSAILLVWLVYGIGQTLESTVLTPKLVGERIGLHPVAVIFAILAGGSLVGFFGVLLALPTAAVIMVLLRFLNKRYKHSKIYQA